MALEVEVGGSKYSIGKLSAMQQFHVSRRIAPIIPSLVPVFSRLKDGDKSAMDDLEWLASSLQPLADGLAALSDADAEYLVGTCLSVVQRRQDHGWASVTGQSGTALMFQDIDMGVMLKLAVDVIVDNLRPFISGLLTSLPSSPVPSSDGSAASPVAKTG